MGNRRRELHKNVSFSHEPIIPQTIDMFLHEIDACGGMTPAWTQRLSSVHKAIKLYLMLDKMSRATVMASGVLKYYMFFYESLAQKPSARFQDCVFGVSLFSGSFGSGHVNMERFSNINSTQLLLDRQKTAAKLCVYDDLLIHARTSKYIPSDIPEGVSMRVAAFVGRARLLTQCCAINSTTCSCCNQRTFETMGEVPRMGHSIPSVIGADDAHYGQGSESDDEEDDEYLTFGQKHRRPSYWTLLIPGTVQTLPTTVFCSTSCALQYQSELAIAIPVDIQSIASDENTIRATGLGRIAASLRAVTSRNEKVFRALRQARSTFRKRQLTALRPETVDMLHKNITDLLHIDLGMLTAAAMIAESAVVARGRTLPGTSAAWRSDRTAWVKAVERVKGVFQAHAGRSSSRCDPRNPPVWLRKVKDDALNIFPLNAFHSEA